MKSDSLISPKLHHCKSCGFISIMKGEFIIFRGVKVCRGCASDYEKDENVTRWINEASARSE